MKQPATWPGLIVVVCAVRHKDTHYPLVVESDRNCDEEQFWQDSYTTFKHILHVWLVRQMIAMCKIIRDNET